jgi:hypothetical protein
MTVYTITTDEPLQRWCVPLHEGQIIEVTEESTTMTPGVMTVPIRRRYVASSSGGELSWVEIPCSRR